MDSVRKKSSKIEKKFIFSYIIYLNLLKLLELMWYFTLSIVIFSVITTDEYICRTLNSVIDWYDFCSVKIVLCSISVNKICSLSGYVLKIKIYFISIYKITKYNKIGVNYVLFKISFIHRPLINFNRNLFKNNKYSNVKCILYIK